MAISGVCSSVYFNDGTFEGAPFDPSLASRAWGREHFITEDCSAPALGVSTLASKIMRLAGDSTEDIVRLVGQINEHNKSSKHVLIALSIMLRFIGMGETLPESVDCWVEHYLEKVLCRLVTSTDFLREFTHLLYPVDHKLNLQACHLIIELVDQPLGFLLNDAQRLQVKGICEQLLERKELFQRLVVAPKVHPSIVADLQHDLGISDGDGDIDALAMRALVLTLFEPIGQYHFEGDCYAVAVARHLQVVDPSILVELICRGMEKGGFVYDGVEIPIDRLTKSRRPTQEGGAATASMNALLEERLVIPRWIVALFEFINLNEKGAEGEKSLMIDKLLPYLGKSLSTAFREHLVDSFYFFRSRLIEEIEAESELSVREMIEPVYFEKGEMINLSTIGAFIDWVKQQAARFGLDSSLLTAKKTREFYASLKEEFVGDELRGDEPLLLDQLGGDALTVLSWEGLGRSKPIELVGEFDSADKLMAELGNDSAFLTRKSLIAGGEGHAYRFTPEPFSDYIQLSIDGREGQVIRRLKELTIRFDRWGDIAKEAGILIPEVLRERMLPSELVQQVRTHLSKDDWKRCEAVINEALYLIPNQRYKRRLPTFIESCGLKPLSEGMINSISDKGVQPLTCLASMTQALLMEEHQGYISMDYLLRELPLHLKRPPIIRIGDLCWVRSDGSRIFPSDLVFRYHILHEKWELCCLCAGEITAIDPSYYKRLGVIRC